MIEEQTRRHFLTATSVGTAASLALASHGLGQARRRPSSRRPARKVGFKLGLASYTLRKFDLDETLSMTKRVGLKYICFKSFHLPLDSTPDHIRQVVAKVKDAGLILYGGGVISMNRENQVHQAFDYAKAAGMKVIIGVPAPELLPLVEQKVKQYDIKVAIHNHGPTDKLYPVPAAAYEKIKGLDKRIGLCNDVGHTQRAGVDPSESAEKYADRLLDVHMKDVSAAEAKGHGVEVGRGVIDVPRLLRTLARIKYEGIVSFEYEKDEDDPLAGLAESVGYVKGVMAAMRGRA
ncbi:MAG: sugar phosphate isomerase/epimerase [Phycisphaerales bacterium]|nr:MAG: sugar phosphate isomerase/epimerase [Phycisphaerales bacterium]